MANRVPQIVKVIALRDTTAADGVKFRMEDTKGEELLTLVFSKDEHGMHKSDVHEVLFTLEQEAGLGLVFATDLDNAMWVNRGTYKDIPSCPQTKPTKTNSVFYADDRQDLTLTVINKNPQKCFYRFSLNFIAPASSNPAYLVRYDPVGDNRNGGTGGFTSSAALLLGLALAAGAALVGYELFLK